MTYTFTRKVQQSSEADAADCIDKALALLTTPQAALAAEDQYKQVEFTSSGSLSSMELGGEGHIWGDSTEAHPVPVYIKVASPALSGKAEVVERMLDAHNEHADYSACNAVREGMEAAYEVAKAALSALPPARDDSGKTEGLAEDLNQLIRVALTNPGDLGGFIQANYPKEYRHFKGRPAVDGKPLELQSRDELLAAVRELEAENDRLSFEANAGRQAEAEADAEAKEMAEALDGLLARLGPNGYILSAGEPATRRARAALARYNAHPRPNFQSRVAF